MSNPLNPEKTLQLLNEIEQNQLGSQRSFSNKLGIAVGLTNLYVKRCLKKGWIKMSRVPARRYAYYITPKGFVEKSRLTAEYLASSFIFFREARQQCLDSLSYCERNGLGKVSLYGCGELAEIAVMVAREMSITLVAIIDPESDQTEFAGLKVVPGLDFKKDVDAVLITGIRAPQEIFDQLEKQIPGDQILTPSMLLISRKSKDEIAKEKVNAS